MNENDVIIVGAGAAGIAAAIFTTRHAPHARVVCLDGAAKLGAKILVAGGGRCNVTNDEAAPADYNGNPHIIRRILAAFTSDDCRDWFAQMGVPLHREETGKWFPQANAGRVVLKALLDTAAQQHVRVLTGVRVTRVARRPGLAGFIVSAGQREFQARRVVLATGGLSLPKTGSDGFGYTIAKSLGHSIVPTTCGLVPMLLDDTLHAKLAGVTHEAAITIHSKDAKPVRVVGNMLWTHFGVSGPVALDASRHWLRAALEQREPTASLSFQPQHTRDTLEQQWLDHAAQHPRASLAGLLRTWIPARVANELQAHLAIDPSLSLAQCPRQTRGRLLHALLELPLRFTGSRGYNYAEVTAGGVPLREIDARSMESRLCPGLHLIGEILDVDGRLGGFNFQWAWSTAAVAGRAIAAAL